MKTELGTRRLRLGRLLALATLVALTACGGGGNPRPQVPLGSEAVGGQVVLPAGNGLNMASLRVSTTFGSVAVGADGSFTAYVDPTADIELGVETANGELVLLGVALGSEVQLRSVHPRRAYYSLAACGYRSSTDEDAQLPRGVEGSARWRRADPPLAAGGNGLSARRGVQAALLAAHEALVPRRRGAYVRRLTFRPWRPATGILIHNITTSKAGAQVLHNPGGSGIVVLNEYRPAALLIYEVAWEDAEGVVTPIEPPSLAGTIDVPATGKLELFNALWDVVTGDAPFAPIISPAADLPGRSGASKTHYELVLIGPSTSDAEWPIVSDERFASLQDEWLDVYMDKSVELFVDELLFPVLETFIFGRKAAVDAANAKAARERLRIIYRQNLKELGAYLSPREARYAQALRYALQELSFNLTLRNQTMLAVVEALSASDRNKLNMDSVNRRLEAGRGQRWRPRCRPACWPAT